jgi:hypothetical protein
MRPRPAAAFEPYGQPVHAQVSTRPVRPLGPAELLGDLVTLHEREGIELRTVPNLWPIVDAARAATVGFSGIRLHNARPR